MIAFITQRAAAADHLVLTFFCRYSVMDKRGNRQRMTILCQFFHQIPKKSIVMNCKKHTN